MFDIILLLLVGYAIAVLCPLPIVSSAIISFWSEFGKEISVLFDEVVTWVENKFSTVEVSPVPVPEPVPAIVPISLAETVSTIPELPPTTGVVVPVIPPTTPVVVPVIPTV